MDTQNELRKSFTINTVSNKPVLGLSFSKHSGPIVRVAPNELILSDPETIKSIYGVNSGFTKVSFPNGPGQIESGKADFRRAISIMPSEPPLVASQIISLLIIRRSMPSDDG